MNRNSIERLRWFMHYGRPVHKVSSEEIVDVLDELRSPVFFLSTGRVATQWYAEYFDRIKGFAAHHAPQPNLAMQSKFLYELYQSDLEKSASDQVAKQIFMTARQEYLRYAYKCSKRYLETNNNLTFFAYAIAELMPQAKFVILFRHPKGFLASGVKRSWYSGNRQAEYRLISQCDQADTNLSVADKILWHYMETNKFILQFCKDYPARVYGHDLIDLSIERLEELHDLLEVHQRVTIRNVLTRKNQNVQNGNTRINYNYEELEFSDSANNIYQDLSNHFTHLQFTNSLG